MQPLNIKKALQSYAGIHLDNPVYAGLESELI